MSKINFFCFCIIFSSYNLLADECFQLSEDGVVWSTTPEIICLKKPLEGTLHTITLKTKFIWNNTIRATFQYNLLASEDQNIKAFGIAAPLDSIFNNLKIVFDDIKKTVMIGKTKFFYREAENKKY